MFNGMLQAFCLETFFFQSWNPSRNSSTRISPYPSGVPHIESEEFNSHVSFSFQYVCHVSFSSRVFSTLPTTKVLEMKQDQVKAPESEGCVEIVIWNTRVATVVPQHLDPGNLVIFYGHIQQFDESLDKICVNGWRVEAFRLVSMEFSFD